MAKTTASFVLILLVVATMNGYSVEGAEKGNKLKNDGDIYKSQKTLGCVFLDRMCSFVDPSYCHAYYKYCTSNGSNPPQPQIIP